MSEGMNERKTNEASEKELDFDSVEYEGEQKSGGTCEFCNRTLQGFYYTINDQVSCESCKFGIESDMQPGGGSKRFLKAVLFGFPAAALGAGIYYAVAALSGYEFGLIAILIGFMVGAAVRAGANRRGGWVYQGLAMMLTYLAIASTYIPPALTALNSEEHISGSESIPAEGENALVNDIGDEPSTVIDERNAEVFNDNSSNPVEKEIAMLSEPVDESIGTTADNSAEVLPASATSAVASKNDQSATGEEPIGTLALIVGIIILLGIAFALPILAGFENIMGLVIIAIGLYQAWTMNRKLVLSVAGPFELKK